MRGWVYIITTKSMPRLLKVGFSTKDPLLRAEDLNNTGNPYPYKVEYDVLVNEPREIEKITHTALKKYHENKEWFNCSIETAIQVIRESANGTVLLENCPFPLPTELKEKTNEEVYSELLYQCMALEEKHDELYEKFRGTVSQFKNLISFNITEVIQSIINSVICELKLLSSPEEIEDIENGFDYWGILKNEGGNNFLYPASEEWLDFSIYQSILKIDTQEKLILFSYILNTKTFSEYFLDYDFEDIPKLILENERQEIIDFLRQHVLAEIPYRDRHE